MGVVIWVVVISVWLPVVVKGISVVDVCADVENLAIAGKVIVIRFLGWRWMEYFWKKKYNLSKNQKSQNTSNKFEIKKFREKTNIFKVP